MKAHTLMPRAPSCLVTAALALALAGLAVIPGEAIAASSPWTARSAPGGPGGTSYLDLGRKDCLGSATTNRYVGGGGGDARRSHRTRAAERDGQLTNPRCPTRRGAGPVAPTAPAPGR